MARELILDGTRVADDTGCYVIAEIGNNHKGDLGICKQMIATAAQLGVNAVKLQKRDNATLFTKAMFDQPYDSRNSFGKTYGIHREFLEFGKDEYTELVRFCRDEAKVTFFATPFDLPSVDFLEQFDLPFYKIASGDLTNLPLIMRLAEMGKPLLISTGGATLDDVRRVYDTVMPVNPSICILQCTSGYPPEFEELNLRVIETYRREFADSVIGFSSHDAGILMPVIAYMLGARIVEKHFTLNRSWKGTDQAFSLAPDGMRRVIRDLDRVRVALGDGVKTIYPSEIDPIRKMHKQIVAARAIPAGHVLTAEDLAFRCPGDGLPPHRVGELLGRKTVKALAPDDSVLPEHVEG